jgi:hypothetical protein
MLPVIPRACPLVVIEGIPGGAVRTSLRERLQRRLALGGHADIAAMYAHYQQDMRAMLERQPVAHRLLAAN